MAARFVADYGLPEYDAAIRYHRDMNFTMIRNWVGMIGDDEFYDDDEAVGGELSEDPETVDSDELMAEVERFLHVGDAHTVARECAAVDVHAILAAAVGT